VEGQSRRRRRTVSRTGSATRRDFQLITQPVSWNPETQLRKIYFLPYVAAGVDRVLHTWCRLRQDLSKPEASAVVTVVTAREDTATVSMGLSVAARSASRTQCQAEKRRSWPLIDRGRGLVSTRQLLRTDSTRSS
jgi:hypothetical protein